jgi:two-component system, NarL family, nitrate/nitrite response regulator NarL
VQSPERSASSALEAGAITVILIDDQELMRSTVSEALSDAGLDVVGEAASAETGVQLVLGLRPDVVLMDFTLEGAPAIEAIEAISRLTPASHVLVLTASTERNCVLEAILAGACGYILKDAGTGAIVDGVRASAAGACVISPEVAGALLTRIREREIPRSARNGQSADAIRAALTERELAIFKRLASGESNQEIGRAFSVSGNTVKNHVASILAKLQLDNRIQAAVQAVRNGFSCAVPLFATAAFADELGATGTLLAGLLAV